METLMIEFQNVLLENLLVLHGVRRLINHSTVFPYFEYIWFYASEYSEVCFTDAELYFNNCLFLIYRVNKLSFTNLTMWFTKQCKRYRIKHSRFTCTIMTYNKCRFTFVKWNFCKIITGRQKVFIFNRFKNDHAISSACASVISSLI